MPTILLDMDDTVADFSSAIAERALNDFGVVFDKDKQTTWHPTCFLSETFTQTHLDLLFDGIKTDYAFWAELDLITPKIEHYVKQWQKQAEVYIVTACSPIAFDAKLAWVDRHLPTIGYKKVIAAYSKWLVKGDILIDDKPETLIKYHKAWPQARLASLRYHFHDQGDLDQVPVCLADDWGALNAYVEQSLRLMSLTHG